VHGPSPYSRRSLWSVPAIAMVPALLALFGGPDTAAAATCAPVEPPAVAPTPSPFAPCLVEVEPYPFGDNGEPVDPASSRCTQPARPCHLTVTSFAFRAWNRGLAATNRGPGTQTFGTWLWNGRNWAPDPTFPGGGTCPGTRVLWAGKLDYWLVGAGLWGRLCRFDGASFQWQPLSVPTPTLDRITDFSKVPAVRPPGGITSGSCQAWNDCWFFGDFGSVLRWNGTTLTDASSDYLGAPWLRGDFRAVATRRDAAGAPVGFAVGTSTAGGRESVSPQPDGSPPPQVFGSDGGPFAPV
jgi:hypothetical protein